MKVVKAGVSQKLVAGILLPWRLIRRGADSCKPLDAVFCEQRATLRRSSIPAPQNKSLGTHPVKAQAL
jgi:hypothetical protein